MRNINNIAVIGSGVMGQGIAQMAAMAGYPTLLYDIDREALEKAQSAIKKNLEVGIQKGKITTEQAKTCIDLLKVTTDLNEVTADFILEAILEDLSLKRKLFNDLEQTQSETTIIASNTSSIPITRLAAGMAHPERFVGMHFFNPPHILKLVEVIQSAMTEPEVMDITKALAKKMGKTPVEAKDSPGFIVNRVARHFYVESLKILEEQVATVEEIDELMRSVGFKMGPFELMDLIGVDTNYAVTESMFKAFHNDPKFRPSRLQQQKVDAGQNGRKSGKGFYNYE